MIKDDFFEIEFVLAENPETTASWYVTNLGFSNKREGLIGAGKIGVSGYGMQVWFCPLKEELANQRRKAKESGEPFDETEYRKRHKERTMLVDVENVLEVRKQFLTRRLKLLNDVLIDGLGLGWIEVEDCDGRIVRFTEAVVEQDNEFDLRSESSSSWIAKRGENHDIYID